MKQFKEFIKEGKVKSGSSDPAEARSLFRQAKERFADLVALPLSDGNAPFRFETAYEVLREALQAFLSWGGYSVYSHEAVVYFAFEKHILSEAQSMRVDRYREIRNDINYRCVKVTVDETKEIIRFVKEILPILEQKFMQIQNKD